MRANSESTSARLGSVGSPASGAVPVDLGRLALLASTSPSTSPPSIAGRVRQLVGFAATSAVGHVVRRAFGRGARLDLRERAGRLEERALHDAVRVEQVVAPAA